MKRQITNQRDLRRAFWNEHSGLDRRRLACGDYRTDTRCAWCVYIDACVAHGVISEALAQRATL